MNGMNVVLSMAICSLLRLEHFLSQSRFEQIQWIYETSDRYHSLDRTTTSEHLLSEGHLFLKGAVHGLDEGHGSLLKLDGRRKLRPNEQPPGT